MTQSNRFSLSLDKLDKLAEDVAKLDIARVAKSGNKVVPSFQREGYLEEANKKTLSWVKRFFVLRDSCLLSYDSPDVEKIVEPQTSVCLGKCKVQLLDSQEDLDKLVGGLIDCKGKSYCIHITTRPDKEHVLISCPTAEDRKAWVDAIKVARTVTHANMVKLSVENRVLAEDKGAAEVALMHSTSALAIFSNKEYIQKTPIAGGAEGWLKTVGFKRATDKKGKKMTQMLDGLFGQSELKKLKKRYCILRDSHLMLYDAGDALLKPRGVLYLVGTKVELLDDDETGTFRFRCTNPEVGDYIDFVASSEKRRRKWVFALKIGARVTYPDFRMLLEEHALLANVVMTPRASAPSAPNVPAIQVEAPPDPSIEDIDLQEHQLDPGTTQPYDGAGDPMLRNPEGKWVDVKGEEVLATTPRYSSSGEQLDSFNRPLPPGAVPMFTKDGTPIGVGPDGRHYLPDGTEVPKDGAHFDASGGELDKNSVTAATTVSQNLNVALKVHAFLAPGNEAAVDVLGRTFRGEAEGDNLVNADGNVVPLTSARRMGDHGMQAYNPAARPKAKESLKIVVENSSPDSEDVIELGCVEIDETTTLADVRTLIRKDMEALKFADFIFLFDMTPMLKYEEANHRALECMPELHVRGNELSFNTQPAGPGFSKKLAEFAKEAERKKQEEEEFTDIMSRVRAGTFLKPVARDYAE